MAQAVLTEGESTQGCPALTAYSYAVQHSGPTEEDGIFPTVYRK